MKPIRTWFDRYDTCKKIVSLRDRIHAEKCKLPKTPIVDLKKNVLTHNPRKKAQQKIKTLSIKLAHLCDAYNTYCLGSKNHCSQKRCMNWIRQSRALAKAVKWPEQNII